MSKSNPAAAATKKHGPSRTRRNTLERKCLTKASKRLFMSGDAFGVFKMVLAAERAAKKKGPLSLAVV